MTTTTTTQTEAAAPSFPAPTMDLMGFSGEVFGHWRDEFHKKGCVVIKNVISKEKAASYCQQQIDWLKSFNLGFDEKDPSTWTAEHLPVSFKGG